MDIRMKQANIESQFNRKLIRERIKEDVDSLGGLQDWITAAVEALETFSNTTYTYDSKNARMAHLRDLELDTLALELLYRTSEFQDPIELVAVAAQVKGILGIDEEVAAVTTAAEILAILAPLGTWRIYKETEASTIKFISSIELSHSTRKLIADGMFLPPMICKPDTLRENRDSGYLTYVDSLILGKRNHHNEDICLDVLNTMNSVALSLNVEFLEYWPEEPSFEINDQFQLDNWNRFLAQSHNIYQMLVDNGNTFYLNHRVDKRGRVYAMGYHINTQGTSFKKASIDLAKTEVVLGVPDYAKL